MAFCEDLIFLTLKVTIDIDKEGNKCDKVREREFGPNLVSVHLDRYLDPFFWGGLRLIVPILKFNKNNKR